MRDFTQAGFRLKAQSDLLRHPDDQHEVQIFEDSVYRSTDRFMLLFERPR
jgi:predicted methyltransferase